MPPPKVPRIDDRDRGQLPVEVEEDDERHDRREDRAGQLHETRADQIADAFGVGHDARNQDAALGRVEVADRQAHDVRLDVLAHVGDRALRGDAQHLRVGERRDDVDDRRRAGRHGQLRQQIPLAAGVITSSIRILGRGRQHEPGQPIDDHHRQADAEALAVRPDERARFFPRARAQLLLGGRGCGGESGSWRALGVCHHAIILKKRGSKWFKRFEGFERFERFVTVVVLARRDARRVLRRRCRRSRPPAARPRPRCSKPTATSTRRWRIAT